jgi:hypothetical protein
MADPPRPCFQPRPSGAFFGNREHAPAGATPIIPQMTRPPIEAAPNGYARRPGSKPATRLAQKHPLAGVSYMYSGDLDFMAASAHALGLCGCESGTH